MDLSHWNFCMRLPHLCDTPTATMRFLRSGKSLLTPKWKNASLRVSENRERIPWRMKSVECHSRGLLLRIWYSQQISIVWWWGLTFLALTHTTFCFTSSYFLQFLEKMRHWASITRFMYLMTSQFYAYMHYFHLGSWWYVLYYISLHPSWMYQFNE